MKRDLTYNPPNVESLKLDNVGRAYTKVSGRQGAGMSANAVSGAPSTPPLLRMLATFALRPPLACGASIVARRATLARGAASCQLPACATGRG